jgi:hypothetical protein
MSLGFSNSDIGLRVHSRYFTCLSSRIYVHRVKGVMHRVEGSVSRVQGLESRV